MWVISIPRYVYTKDSIFIWLSDPQTCFNYSFFFPHITLETPISKPMWALTWSLKGCNNSQETSFWIHCLVSFKQKPPFLILLDAQVSFYLWLSKMPREYSNNPFQERTIGFSILCIICYIRRNIEYQSIPPFYKNEIDGFKVTQRRNLFWT